MKFVLIVVALRTIGPYPDPQPYERYSTMKACENAGNYWASLQEKLEHVYSAKFVCAPEPQNVEEQRKLQADLNAYRKARR
jgi:hypothetical protein